MKRVVITGIGPVTPIGVGKAEFWDNALNCVSGTRRLESLPLDFPVSRLKSQLVARVNDDCLPPSDAATTRFLRMGLFSCDIALNDANLDPARLKNAGVVVGSAVAGTAAMEATYLQLKEHRFRERKPYYVPGLLRDLSFHSLAAEIAGRHGCGGPVLTVSTGCTAGIDAIGMGADLVRFGRSKVVVVGGVDAPLTPVAFACFDVIGALSTNNLRPSTASRPFDCERDGFVLGEGAAFLVLEELAHATARNANVYAELTGFASVSNSFHMTDLPNDGDELANCITLALRNAGLKPSDADHVNAHGSSTPQNDICETNAIKRAFGRYAEKLTVNSLKALTGHALGASNAIEVAACALAIQRQEMFPTAHLDQPGEGCDLDYIPHKSRKMRVRNLLKLSSGFSGIHSALVLSAPR